ncbi:MAG TPA: tRNA (adenosine(37)-N6)-dimethylallyltransferase MiaA [bacterium]|nr:tRNA (adenosine(37)-N6)-dimethylallyltransferase MiaA [bacterium]
MVPPPVKDPSLVVICGPTAVGKTAASVILARRISGEIIAADSRTIYRFMDIGTAKPTPEQRRAILHHLLDIADPDEVITLAVYRRMAADAMAAIRERGSAPILVGGSGLYIRAVADGFVIPEVPPDSELRDRLVENERNAPGTLHARLATVDPLAAARIHPRNTRRLIRALEVYEHTGRPISALQRRADPGRPTTRIGLTMDRDALYRRIDARVDEQIEGGLIDEVKALLDRNYARTLPAMQGLGYKEIVEYLDGAASLEEATLRLKRNTRRFAKRQYTWFRRDSRIEWIDVDELPAEVVAARIRAVIE